MIRSDIERAISIVQNSREIHVGWKRYIEEFPEEASKPRPEIDTAGDCSWHQGYIDDYDFVLKVLGEIEL